jgi:ABC-type thiamine transport system substrate-binding protein
VTHDKNFKKLEEAIDQTFDEFQNNNDVKLVNKKKMKETFTKMLSLKDIKKNDVVIGLKSFSIFNLEQEMPRIKTSTLKY